MAVDFSKKQLDKAFINGMSKYFPLETNTFIKKIIRIIFQKYFLLKWSLFNLKQKIYSFFDIKSINKKNFKYPDFEIIGLSSKNKELDIRLNELEDKGYTFISNFLDKNSHESLKLNFPKFNNFLHTKKVIKNYFYCFLYEKKKNNRILNIQKYPEYQKLFDTLSSQNFENLFNNLIDKDKNNNTKIFSSFLCTIKKEGSFLIPHMDGLFNSANKANYNFIYFIEGNNEYPTYSAGTGIYADRDFEKPLLVPKNLTNSCLLYKTADTNKFYHGFDVVKQGGFAKVITFEMQDLNLV